MKKCFVILALILAGFSCKSQNIVMFKDLIKKNPKDTTLFPIHSSFRITETPFSLYKNLELWVYDAKNREILYVSQNIPVRDEYMDIIDKMIDKEYAALMMKHGHLLDQKSIAGSGENQ